MSKIETFNAIYIESKATLTIVDVSHHDYGITITILHFVFSFNNLGACATSKMKATGLHSSDIRALTSIALTQTLEVDPMLWYILQPFSCLPRSINTHTYVYTA